MIYMMQKSDVYKEYDSDYADIDVERDFERDMYELKNQGIIDIRVKDKRIDRIVLLINKIEKIYIMLGREAKKDIIQKQLDMYRGKLGNHELIDKYCNHQIDLLQSGKKAKALLDKGLYETEMRYMLNHNVNLEPEIVSWMNIKQFS